MERKKKKRQISDTDCIISVEEELGLTLLLSPIGLVSEYVHIHGVCVLNHTRVRGRLSGKVSSHVRVKPKRFDSESTRLQGVNQTGGVFWGTCETVFHRCEHK